MRDRIPDIMATHSYRKALAYLIFSVFTLIASIMMIVLFTTHLSDHLQAQVFQSEAQMNSPLAIVFGLVLTSGSLLSLRTAWQNFYIAQKLEKNGHLADGVITNKWIDTFERRVLYHVSYRFHEDMEVWEAISKSLYQKLSKGCNVPIRFLEHNPSVSRLDNEQISA